MSSPHPDAIPLVDLGRLSAAIKTEIAIAMGEVVGSSAFVRGPAVDAFEEAFAALHGLDHAVGVGSGTDALALAVRALGIGPGDEVVTQPNTWISTAFAVSYAGATPVFADVDPRTLQMDPAALVGALTPRTRAVIPVHMFGHPAPMTEITEICRGRGIRIIEDVAQAVLARTDGRLAGTFGDLACFSFYPSKNLGCWGDGGAVLTGDADLAAEVRRLADYGREAPYRHGAVGWNARLDTLQAAILLAKLPYLETWTEARRRAAAAYDEHLAGVAATPLATAPGARPVHYVYVVQVEDRDACLAHLRGAGVMAQVHYPGTVHLQPCYADLGYAAGAMPVAEAAAGRILSLPMFPEITDAEVGRVVATLADAVAPR